jgi:hypothetical protein
MFNDGHFAEYFAGAKPGENPAFTPARRDFYQTGFHKINAVASLTFAKNYLAGSKAAFLRDRPQRLKFSATQGTE